MLHEFLILERAGILALCEAKLAEVSDARSSTLELEAGLPIFYDELVAVLHSDVMLTEMESDQLSQGVHQKSAERHGRESFRLGYTISQVVHGYGTLCQAITEFAVAHGGNPISAREFNRLNMCLDIAIAQAVTEYNKSKHESVTRQEVQRLGFLAHEMRNALATMSTAHRMMQKGIVGFGGSTNQVFEDALWRMRDIIDRALSEVRLRGEPAVNLQLCRVVDMVGEVEATSILESNTKSINLHIEVGSDLVVLADRHLMISAISNLVQNAIKFTRAEGSVWIRGRGTAEQVLIEVEDECGGLPAGKIEGLFEAYSQKGSDRSGMGLGLSIARRVMALNNGDISALDIPGRGCIFTITMPRVPALAEEIEGVVLPVQ